MTWTDLGMYETQFRPVCTYYVFLQILGGSSGLASYEPAYNSFIFWTTWFIFCNLVQWIYKSVNNYNLVLEHAELESPL